MTLSEHLRLDASGLDGDVRAGTLSGWYLQVANRMREAADALDARQAPAEPPADLQETIAGLERRVRGCGMCDGERGCLACALDRRALSLLRSRVAAPTEKE